MTTPCIIEKRRAAQALRASKRAARVEARKQAEEAKKAQASDRQETKRQKKLQLQQEKLLKEQTKAARAANLEADRDAVKAKKAQLTVEQQALRDRKERNARLRAIVDAKRQEVAAKLGPKETDAVRGYMAMIENGTGLEKQTATRNLGKLIADIRGVPLIPGSDPWQTLWQSNVLFSIGTNTSNIFGNVTTPFIQVARDLGRGNVRKAGRFIRGWAGQIFNKQTWRDIVSGNFGELASRSEDVETPTDLKDLASGVKTLKETDAIRILESRFGTGALAKVFLTSPGWSLRMLGAMDAVFSRASQQGRFAREAPSYKEFLDDRLQAYTVNRAVAEQEAAKIRSLGGTVPRDYVNRRTDELTTLQKPEEVRERVLKASRKDVFQAEGPTGAIAQVFKGALQGFSERGAYEKDPQYLNAQPLTLWAKATGRRGRVARDDATLDEVYPLVMKGIAEGRSVEINGQPVRGSTNTLLGEIVEALQQKQLINLRGGTVKPYKYVVGQFVNTASQILDLGIETIPFLGYIDKRVGKFHEFTDEERTQLAGLQAASFGLTLGMFLMAISQLDEEEPWLRVNGPMRDNALRKFHEARKVKPYSMEVFGKTFYYKDVPGVNLILGGIGEMTDQYLVAKRTPDRPMSGFDYPLAIAMGALYSGTQLSMLKNLQTLADTVAVQEKNFWQAGGDILTNVFGGFVPYAGTARELERFVFGDLSKPKDLQSRLLQNIPLTKFFSDVKPALNLFGEPVNTTILPGINRFIGNTENVPELNWLLQTGYKITLPKPNAPLTEKQQQKYAELLKSDDPDTFETVLSEDHQYRYMQLLGPELRLIIHEQMKKHPTGWSQKVQDKLNKEVNEAKVKIKKQILKGQ